MKTHGGACFNPSIQETEVGGSLEFKAALVYKREFQERGGYTEKATLSQTNKQTNWMSKIPDHCLKAWVLNLCCPKCKVVTLNQRAVYFVMPTYRAEPGLVGGNAERHTWLQIKALLSTDSPRTKNEGWLAYWLHDCSSSAETQPPSGSDLAQRFLNWVGGWNDRRLELLSSSETKQV